MPTPIYVVDAFTGKPFSGNPAAVCVLESEADPLWMQSVAAEMKHAETAFVRRIFEGFELRWFTPTVEVDLCGHATLASAHVLWSSGRHPIDLSIAFQTRSGTLTASKGSLIQLDFPKEAPAYEELPFPIPNLAPTWTGKNRMDWIIEVESENEVRTFEPEFESIANLGMRGLQITSRGEGEYDFISRFFAPAAGVDEDPVTGSAHCCLGPYWGAKLGKSKLHAFQASPRGGVVDVVLLENRVLLLGEATTVLEGQLTC